MKLMSGIFLGEVFFNIRQYADECQRKKGLDLFLLIHEKVKQKNLDTIILYRFRV